MAGAGLGEPRGLIPLGPTSIGSPLHSTAVDTAYIALEIGYMGAGRWALGTGYWVLGAGYWGMGISPLAGAAAARWV